MVKFELVSSYRLLNGRLDRASHGLLHLDEGGTEVEGCTDRLLQTTQHVVGVVLKVVLGCVEEWVNRLIILWLWLSILNNKKEVNLRLLWLLGQHSVCVWPFVEICCFGWRSQKILSCVVGKNSMLHLPLRQLNIGRVKLGCNDVRTRDHLHVRRNDTKIRTIINLGLLKRPHIRLGHHLVRLMRLLVV